MSMEFVDEEELFLAPRDFVNRALGKLRVDRIDELTPRQKMEIALAFQLAESDRDMVVTAPSLCALEASETQRLAIEEQLCGRGARMMTMLQLLIGYEGNFDFSDQKYIR